jgi:hypothetical protein
MGGRVPCHHHVYEVVVPATPAGTIAEEAQMQMAMDNPLSEERSIEAALERLRRDLFGAPSPQASEEPEGPEPIDFASLEFELERMRKRLAIWEIFVAYVRDGARSWPDVQRSLTQTDLDRIASICDGVPLRDLLLDLR